MKGKKRQGGQSADRMTFDCHVAAGINEIVRDMHLNMGSCIKIGICRRCHSVMGYYNAERREWICPRCGAHQDFIIREMPHASGLMNHIMNGMHISLDYFDAVSTIPNDNAYDVRGAKQLASDGSELQHGGSKDIAPVGKYVGVTPDGVNIDVANAAENAEYERMFQNTGEQWLD